MLKARLARLPILVILALGAGLGMWLPAMVAARDRDWSSAQAYFYSGLLTLIIATLVAIVTRDRPIRHRVQAQLLSLLGAFLALPLILAVPLYESLGNTSYLNAYLEMVAAITTTGGSVYDTLRLDSADDVWRALVAWSGGLLMWSAAVAIFAPLGLGGYEVTQSRGTNVGLPEQMGATKRASTRLVEAIALLFPMYAGLTLALFVSLLIAGDGPLVSAVHAMGTMSTSGMSPVGGIEGASSGRAGEFIVALFFVFALSRAAFAHSVFPEIQGGLRQDPELRLAVVVVLAVTLGLWLRHFVGATQTEDVPGLIRGLQAMWGALFTTLSFLSTTGYASGDWVAARGWSGLEAPGLILMGLALIGGGVATTAGGVKLLRVYALLKHGEREVDRLVYPSSIGGAGRLARHVRKEGAFIAWVVFMLLAVSLAALMLALSVVGVAFEDALILSVAALTNTGPLVDYAAATPIETVALPAGAKLALAFGMALGRVETLVLVALLNPAFWRV
ncbi:MAG: potassium transporter TrkG [Pseudomonadota bacterium]